MDPADEEACMHCGGPIERGFISWTGDPHYWSASPRPRRIRRWRLTPLVMCDRMWRPADVPVRRCMSCRTVSIPF